VNPGGGAGTDSSRLSLHGLPSIDETFSRKSQGYAEYGPVDATFALFLNGVGLADDELADGCGVFVSEKNAPIENTARTKRKTTMIGCSPAQSKMGPQLYPNRRMTFGVAVGFAVVAEGVAGVPCDVR
jgi:hypothetical protein